jgi:hypothetical protein
MVNIIREEYIDRWKKDHCVFLKKPDNLLHMEARDFYPVVIKSSSPFLFDIPVMHSSTLLQQSICVNIMNF